jgi:hypothetical protein
VPISTSTLELQTDNRNACGPMPTGSVVRQPEATPGACADAPHMSQPREAAADSLPSADLAVDPSGADSVEPPDGGFPASSGGSSAASGSPAPTRRTQAQHGISKPKNYTYGTIRYAFTSVTGEPETLGEAFEDGNW